MSGGKQYIKMVPQCSEGDTVTYTEPPKDGQNSWWTKAGDKMKEKAGKTTNWVKENHKIIAILIAVLTAVLFSVLLVRMNSRIGELESAQVADEESISYLNRTLAEVRNEADSSSRQNEQILVMVEALNVTFEAELHKLRSEAAKNLSKAVADYLHQIDRLNATFETNLLKLSIEVGKNLSQALGDISHQLATLNASFNTELQKIRAEAGKNISKAVDGLSQRFTQHAQEIADTISEVQKQIEAELKKAAISTKTDYDSMRSNVDSIKADMTQGFSDRDVRIGKVESGLQKQTSSMKTEHDNIGKTAENLQTQLTNGLNNHAARLGKVESGLQTHKSNVVDQLRDHDYKIKHIQNTLNSHGNTANNHGQRIGSLEGRVRELESSGYRLIANTVIVVLTVSIFFLCTV